MWIRLIRGRLSTYHELSANCHQIILFSYLSVHVEDDSFNLVENLTSALQKAITSPLQQRKSTYFPLKTIFDYE